MTQKQIEQLIEGYDIELPQLSEEQQLRLYNKALLKAGVEPKADDTGEKADKKVKPKKSKIFFVKYIAAAAALALCTFGAYNMLKYTLSGTDMLAKNSIEEFAMDSAPEQAQQPAMFSAQENGGEADEALAEGGAPECAPRIESNDVSEQGVFYSYISLNNNGGIILMAVTAILAVLVGGYVFLIFPKKPTKQMLEPFYRRNFAHRGLHTKDKSVPENSLEAFKKAVASGYGMELDIQLTKDGKIVVFHDDTIDRVCAQSGGKGRVDSYTYDELLQFSLCETDYKIPLFEQVLEAVNGKAPMIVELKSSPNNKELCEKALAMLSSYKGDYCIESFDPRIVSWFRKNAPQIMRGQLANSYREYKGAVPKYQAFILSRVLSNVAARPHFIAYDKKRKSLSAKLSNLFGAARIVWTVRDTDDIEKIQNKNDMVIFEFYSPHVKY